MAWASEGEGDQIVISIPGGPGNPAPGSSDLKYFSRLVDAGYRVICVARCRNMPSGHSVEDMANDYAKMIDDEFDGQVKLIIGSSYGGIIAQYIAANHDQCFEHIVVHVAACQVDPVYREFDYGFAKKVSERKPVQAGMIMAKGLFPHRRFQSLVGVFLGFYVWFSMRKGHAHFCADTLIEGEAERLFNSRAVLPDVKVAVLLVAGDEDVYFPKELTLETESLIRDCQLRMYEGKGHIGAAVDPRFCDDILDFVAARFSRRPKSS